MKLLFVSNLFPDAADPIRGLDNACLLHALRGQVGEIRVLAVRPTLGRARPMQARPEDETLLPRFCPVRYIPKVGSRWNHLIMAWTLRREMERLRREYPFDGVLASWLYPDGCAVAKVASTRRFPFWLICQGSDAHAYLGMPVRRRLIVAAAEESRGVITRSADLAQRLGEAGVGKGKLHPIYNGVDTEVFRPAADPVEARRGLGLDPHGEYLLFVGNFLPVKNPSLLLEAWQRARTRAPELNLKLIMIGAGPLEDSIRASAAAAGLQDHLQLPGRLPPSRVADFLRAARCLVMSSHNEGVPNVVLEALASGVPVVSTDVGGVGEIVNEGLLGTLVPAGDAEALGEAIAAVVRRPSQSDAIAALGRRFSWSEATRQYLELLERDEE